MDFFCTAMFSFVLMFFFSLSCLYHFILGNREEEVGSEEEIGDEERCGRGRAVGHAKKTKTD